MMTTAKAFGITRPGDHIAQTQAVQQQVEQKPNPDTEKFKILSEAVVKFMNKEITKAELEKIQSSLK